MNSDPPVAVIPEPEETSAQPFAPARVQKGMEASAALERDAQLMLQVRAGDETSFALLLERHRGPVNHFLYRMVQNQAISEELAQEVFLRVYKSRQKYEPTAKFTTWLYRIATHLALNWIRDNRKTRNQQSLDQPVGNRQEGETERQWATDEPSVEEDLVRDVRSREIRAAIDALPEKQRAAVLMHKYDVVGYTQISKALECSESATKSLLFRAYESLRARLAHLA
ncbi:MAG: RNA polymerase sigma factor [Acidobacteriota bacterium]